MVRTLLAALLVAGSAQAQQDTTSTVTGTVRIDGKVTRPKVIPLDAACTALHPDPLRTEATLVDAENRVRNAFVWVKKGVTGKYPVPAEAFLLDQVGCRYEPHVFGIRVGQTLKIRNSDAMLHNVHGLGMNNKEFNFGQPVQGQVNDVKLSADEVMMRVKCDVHGWMSSWAGVLEHPFYAVSDATGGFTIKGLPPGKYTIGAWQEEWTVAAKDGKYGWEAEVEVKAGETKTLSVVLDKKKE